MEEKRNQEQESLQLRNIVDVKELQRMQNRLSDATGLAAVILDAFGQPVTKAGVGFSVVAEEIGA